MNGVFTSLAVGCALLCANSALAGDVRITFTGAENAKSNVRTALFASESSYEADRSTVRQMVPAEGEGLEIVFENVKPGTYCIASFQDLNGNEKLDRNVFGMPTEPYGHSNNARGRFGPPSFDEISFDVGSEPVNLEIQLH